MRIVDKFGAWILDTRIGMIFAIFIIVVGASVFISKSAKSVTINASEFVCVQAEPWGIATRCTVYSRVK